MQRYHDEHLNRLPADDSDDVDEHHHHGQGSHDEPVADPAGGKRVRKQAQRFGFNLVDPSDAVTCLERTLDAVNTVRDVLFDFDDRVLELACACGDAPSVVLRQEQEGVMLRLLVARA